MFGFDWSSLGTTNVLLFAIVMQLGLISTQIGLAMLANWTTKTALRKGNER